jgi:hypothetical protein
LSIHRLASASPAHAVWLAQSAAAANAIALYLIFMIRSPRCRSLLSEDPARELAAVPLSNIPVH